MAGRIGEVARDLRRSHAVTLMDIANRAGVNESTVSRFETGNGRQPLATVDRLIAAYAVECAMDPAEIWRAAINRWS